LPVLSVVFGSSSMMWVSSSADGRCSTPWGDDDELAWKDRDVALRSAFANSHFQCAFNHEEQLVLDIVMVPDEFTLQLHQLDLQIVHLADDLRTVLVVKQQKLLDQIDLLHLSSPRQIGFVV
jgi:hypothetical protein